MLRLMGAGAAGLVAGATFVGGAAPANAQGNAQTTEAPRPIGFFAFQVGELQVTVIRDGARPLDPAILGANAPEGAVAKLLADNNLPNPINNTFNVLLVRSGEKLALIDTGLGAAAGSLLPTLEALGIARDTITDVVFSHQHGDHIGAALIDGALTFGKAMYHYPEAEKAVIDAAAENPGIVNNRNLLKAAGDAGQLTVYKADTEVLPGVLSVAAYGHTPGHTAFMLSSGDQSLLCTIDSALNNVVNMAHPEWHIQFDADKVMAVETRKRLFGEAADKKMRVLAYHFAFPGTGYVVRDGEGFRFFSAT
jgi:glyoxylase-like metal-dependent hydrolase (beta-lactamase superfamily II)